jgi:hypothetical protein
MCAFYPAAERRQAPRRRVLKAAQISISDRAPKLGCTARNGSATGACLEIGSTTVGLPTHFTLVLDGLRHSCRVTWKTETRMGVAFIR